MTLIAISYLNMSPACPSLSYTKSQPGKAVIFKHNLMILRLVVEKQIVGLLAV